ncbi:HPr kinase [Gloeobacter kilaueensis]|uniref:HPr kinase n=1 Tax=Gloeobacter kilaueensis (strain ATCC BAA-2537 / CCAP 1431/1 / ULC 316 / JS1) TaxID=1183438 RepID=U5QFN1_GLOK1|nr:HPr kinase [Gloeobacter kilaueensis]AGY57688.1 HPr kinase [Gloeobacter kilaueensis JS1]
MRLAHRAPSHLDLLGQRVSVSGPAACRIPLMTLLAPFAARPASDSLIVRFSEGSGGGYRLELPSLCCWGSAAELVPFCEWWLVSRSLVLRPELCPLHGAAVARGEAAILLPGASGSGKTTLTLALLGRGFVPFADDLILLDEQLAVQPFERCFHIDEQTERIVERLAVAPLLAFEHLPPGYCRPRRWATPRPPRCIVWPEYRPGLAAPQLVALRPGHCWTLLVNQLIAGSAQANRHFARLRALVDSAPAWQLAYSEPEQATGAIEKLLVAGLG